jgi:leucyl aminopeptidase
VDRTELLQVAGAVALVRDLVNTPAGDLGPEELEAAAKSLASRHQAKLQVISGKELAKGFPLIHAVGAASPRAPRLIDFTTGPADAPKVTIVGKGVCFDTGGLDIKSSSNMALMKKDMGGAANALGLAAMIMQAGLAVRLRVIIPAVDNVIAGDAFRPGDVLRSRKGLTVEIGNTDAEGRLVLADALTLADEEAPDLLIDLATLTGAARVALGPDLPAFFTDDEEFARAAERHGKDENDPVWRLPLWERYHSLFESKIADLNNAGTSGFAGSITAALFLKRFVERAKIHAHFDIYAWTPTSRPGRPVGGEAQAIRGLYALIRERYR